MPKVVQSKYKKAYLSTLSEKISREACPPSNLAPKALDFQTV